MSNPILEARSIQKFFHQQQTLFAGGKKWIKAVDGVSLTLEKGESLGLVGESGSGKSTLARTLLRLTEPTAGSLHFRGQDFFKLSGASLRRERRHIQMIFQDPTSSLDPRLRVDQILKQPFLIHNLLSAKEREIRVRELLALVGLDPETMATRRIQEFSGGQRQRLCIARAIALEPELIICDEPVSALDVSVQAQILNLLKDLQEKMNLTFLFISHDLSVVDFFCDRVAVMSLGKIVEIGRKNEVFAHPQHPYTQNLLASLPRFAKGKRNLVD